MRDQFGNLVTTAKPTDLVLSSTPVTGGTFGAVTCSFGVCSSVYTAPAAAGTDTITVTIQATNIQNSPVTMTITP